MILGEIELEKQEILMWPIISSHATFHMSDDHHNVIPSHFICLYYI